MSDSVQPPKPTVLIIGLDGATFDNIKPWVEEGKLPTFKRLMDQGVHGTLRSTFPPVTAPAWTSFMTGKNPGKHGLYHFIEPTPKGYELRYTNARSRMARTVWQILTESKKKVGVINVPMTYPPEPVDGYMISGMDAPADSTAITYPKELYQELGQKFDKVSKQVRFLGNLKTDERRDGVLKSLEEADEHYRKMTTYLLEKHPVDVAMVVFTSTDTVQHFFYHYKESDHPQHDAAGAAKYKDAILNVYKRADDIIRDFTSKLPKETTVVLMSDHGFRATSSRVLHLNRFLQECGLLKRKKSGGSSFLRPIIKKIDSLIRGNLSSNQKDRLANLFPALRQKWEQQYGGFADIDWANTKAYCYEVLTFPPGIWINQKGVRPEGTVEAGAEYDQVVETITKKLYELKDPVTGKQLISHVYRKEEIYQGPQLAHAPDLTLAWWDGVTFLTKQAFGDGQVIEYFGGQPLSAGDWSGGHALDGIVGFHGPAFRKGLEIKDAAIVDVTPTLLYLLGLPVPEDMDGKVLLQAFTDEFTTSHSVTTRGDGDDRSSTGQSDQTYSEDESDKVAERLRGLGYIE
jgi:predicted AlkP superfamily phosphohydrolase/phosphomutase